MKGRAYVVTLGICRSTGVVPRMLLGHNFFGQYLSLASRRMKSGSPCLVCEAQGLEKRKKE